MICEARDRRVEVVKLKAECVARQRPAYEVVSREKVGTKGLWGVRLTDRLGPGQRPDSGLGRDKRQQGVCSQDRKSDMLTGVTV